MALKNKIWKTLLFSIYAYFDNKQEKLFSCIIYVSNKTTTTIRTIIYKENKLKFYACACNDMLNNYTKEFLFLFLFRFMKRKTIYLSTTKSCPSVYPFSYVHT